MLHRYENQTIFPVGGNINIELQRRNGHWRAWLHWDRKYPMFFRFRIFFTPTMLEPLLYSMAVTRMPLILTYQSMPTCSPFRRRCPSEVSLLTMQTTRPYYTRRRQIYIIDLSISTRCSRPSCLASSQILQPEQWRLNLPHAASAILFTCQGDEATLANLSIKWLSNLT